jgi:type II secretory pathway predicted ATPase ExeA
MAITDITPAKAAEGRAKALAVRQERVLARQQKAEVVWRIVDETEDLGPAALAAALTLIERLAEDPDADPLAVLRLANAAETVHRISRLASNQSTSNVASQKVMSDDERRELLARLRGTAASQPDSAPGDTAT